MRVRRNVDMDISWSPIGRGSFGLAGDKKLVIELLENDGINCVGYPMVPRVHELVRQAVY